MIKNYIQNDYLNDLRVFDGDDIPQHGSFGMLCGMTMGKLFEPQNCSRFTNPSYFLCCLYELNLINQGIYTFRRDLHFEWQESSLPFLDCRGCDSGHGGWLCRPNAILTFAADPSYVPRATPVEISNELLKDFTKYFFEHYLVDVFDQTTLNSNEFLARIIGDSSCPEVQAILKEENETQI